MQSQHILVGEHGPKCLDPPPVQYRRPVHQNESVLRNSLESRQRGWVVVTQHPPGLVYGNPASRPRQLSQHQWLEQRLRHASRQSALVVVQVISRRDNGSGRVVDGFPRHRRGKPSALSVQQLRQAPLPHQRVDGALQRLLRLGRRGPAAVGLLRLGQRGIRLEYGEIKRVDPPAAAQKPRQQRKRLDIGQILPGVADQIPPGVLDGHRQLDMPDLSRCRCVGEDLVGGRIKLPRPATHAVGRGELQIDGRGLFDRSTGLVNVEKRAIRAREPQIQTKASQLQDQTLYRIGHRRTRQFVAGEQGVVRLAARRRIVRLQGQHLLENVPGAVGLQSPCLHHPDPLTCPRTSVIRPSRSVTLIRSRPRAPGLPSVVDHVHQLHEILVAHGGLVIEESSRAPIAQPQHAAFGKSSLDEHGCRVLRRGAVEAGRDHGAVELVRRQTHVGLQ